MGTIAVKLTPKTTNIDGTDHVLLFEILLVGNGPGTSAITTSTQEAVIEFFEEGDSSELIGHIVGNVKLLADKKIQFDLSAAFGETFVDPTDFILEASFNVQSFKGSMPFNLTLPWKVPKSGKVEMLSVGAQLKIANALEVKAFSASTDKLDIPLKHENVPDPDDVDDAGNPIKSTCFGAGTVYPEDNRLGVKVSQPSTGVQVLLHSSLRISCNALEPGQYNLSSIQTHLNTIFSTGNLNKITVSEPADTTIDKDWKLAEGTLKDGKFKDGTLWSKTVANPPEFFDNDGHLVPFFQFLFSGTTKSAGAGVAARAESLTEPKSAKVIASSKKKKIIHAGVVVADSGSMFANGFKTAGTADEKNKLLANVLSHEIGHALGLAHGLDVINGGYDTTITIGLMTDLTSGKTVKLQAPGPVHVKVLKKLYP